jgi:hypothetical protein
VWDGPSIRAAAHPRQWRPASTWRPARLVDQRARVNGQRACTTSAPVCIPRSAPARPPHARPGGPPASRPPHARPGGPPASRPAARLAPGSAARPGNPARLAPGERGPAGSGYRLSRSSGAVTCSETRPTSRFAAFPRSATTIPIVPSDHGVASPGRPGSPGSPGARETRHRGRNASCTRDEALTIKASGAPRRGIRRRRGIRSLAAPAGRVSPWRRPPRGPWPSRP